MKTSAERVKQYRERKKALESSRIEALEHYQLMHAALTEIACIPSPENPEMIKVCGILYRTKQKIDKILN